MGKNQVNFEEVKSCGELNENQRVISSPEEGKGTRLWKKVKYQLVEYHALPGYLKDNEYILGHYRHFYRLLLVPFSDHLYSYEGSGCGRHSRAAKFAERAAKSGFPNIGNRTYNLSSVFETHM